jgi:predicted NBD/HSP70 family sugar kinase
LKAAAEMKKIYLSKAKGQIARHNTIRDINKQIVLNYVRARSPISRAEIARETSLQRSTVSAIVDDLQLAGMIEEIGTGDSTGGRRPTLLKIKMGTPTVIGIDIAPRETTIALADLACNVLKKEKFPTSADIDYMNEQILGKVEKLVDDHPGADLEVGISIPGIADQDSGQILYIPYFHWSNWDIGKQISEKIHVPVTIDNDANAVALAELWFGQDVMRTTRNFILVLVADGIGTGIIIDGQVYRGEGGAAGEFGHMFVADNAAVTCSCGRHDCWEAHASEKAIISRYQNIDGNADNVAIDFDHLIGLAQNGERQALATLKESAKYLGIGISNLIIGFSPQTVVISGNIARAWDLIKDEIDVLAQRSIRHELKQTRIVPSTLGAEPTVLGAITLVLAQKFASASF